MLYAIKTLQPYLMFNFQLIIAIDELWYSNIIPNDHVVEVIEPLPEGHLVGSATKPVGRAHVSRVLREEGGSVVCWSIVRPHDSRNVQVVLDYSCTDLNNVQNYQVKLGVTQGVH